MFRRLKQWVAAHTVLSAVLVTLVFATGAAAAWIIYDNTVSGSANGQLADAQHVGSLTITPNGAGTAAGQGESGLLSYYVTNNTPNDKQITSLNAVVTMQNPATCPNSNVVVNTSDLSQNYPGGAVNQPWQRSYSVSPSAPAACASQTFSVAFSGTTN